MTSQYAEFAEVHTNVQYQHEMLVIGNFKYLFLHFVD